MPCRACASPTPSPQPTHPQPTHTQPTHPQPTFRDAVGVALELADLHRSGVATVVAHHHQLEPGPARLVAGTFPAALLDALGSLFVLPAPPLAVLVSLDHDRPPTLGSHQLGLFRWAQAALAAAGTTLADWIVTDGDLVRSAAFAADRRRAWPHDPPHERLLDQVLLGLDLAEPSPGREPGPPLDQMGRHEGI